MSFDTFIKLILNACELGGRNGHENLRLYRDETIMDVIEVLYPEEYNKRIEELKAKESEE